MVGPAAVSGEEFREAHAFLLRDLPEGIAALSNLESRMSLFGLQGQFGEFTALLASLAGLPDVSYRPLNVTAQNAVDVPQGQIDELRSLLAEDVTFYDRACQLYRGCIEAMKDPTRLIHGHVSMPPRSGEVGGVTT